MVWMSTTVLYNVSCMFETIKYQTFSIAIHQRHLNNKATKKQIFAICLVFISYNQYDLSGPTKNMKLQADIACEIIENTSPLPRQSGNHRGEMLCFFGEQFVEKFDWKTFLSLKWAEQKYSVSTLCLTKYCFL